MNLPINEEEVLNQVLMAYTLEYPWVIHQNVLRNLTTDFFTALYTALAESKITFAASIDSKGVLGIFSREVRTTVICCDGNTVEHRHNRLVLDYHNTMDKYRRGLRP